ncbi:MAG: spore coat protein [Bacilli bacterium]|nr:spore coat protein [Bacilli bacterium]
MTNIIQNIAGMSKMTDEIIAYDSLIGTKAGVKAYSLALTEAYSQEVRDTYSRHLDAAIKAHEKIVNYMVEKNYYFPRDPEQQINYDLKGVDTLLEME